MIHNRNIKCQVERMVSNKFILWGLWKRSGSGVTRARISGGGAPGDAQTLLGGIDCSSSHFSSRYQFFKLGGTWGALASAWGGTCPPPVMPHSSGGSQCHEPKAAGHEAHVKKHTFRIIKTTPAYGLGPSGFFTWPLLLGNYQ